MRFSDSEQRLLRLTRSERLRDSLTSIRRAVKAVWAPDSPRIVQDFTDHSIRHSERMADYAVRFLAANTREGLSDREAYLLLAGIYLHDLGMQCDVVKFPRVKERATALGAEFEVDFTASRSSQYSLAEQKAIRSNHHYLTAAWIDDLDRTRQDTTLGLAIRTVPKDLVDDLMDICKYHSTLPVDECPEMLKLYPTGRKRLVAALLRLSDELDIDSRRVNLEVVQNYSLDPHNSVYWWLHERAIVSFVSSNAILIQVWLSPDDVKDFGDAVETAFIDRFRDKNRLVLDVLVENNIPVVVSRDSRVIELDRADPLPSEIAVVLNETQEGMRSSVELEPIEGIDQEELGEGEGFLDWAVEMAEAGASLNRSMNEVGELAKTWAEESENATKRLENVQGDPRRAKVVALEIAHSTNRFADAVNETSGEMRDDWNSFCSPLRAFISMGSGDVRNFVDSSGIADEYVEEVRKIETVAGSVHDQIEDLSRVVETSRLQLLTLRGISRSLNKAVHRADLSLMHFSETLDGIMDDLLQIAHLASVSPSLRRDSEEEDSVGEMDS